MMRKFRFGKFTFFFGKYEVSLRKFERMVYIYQWQKVAKWQFGHEQQHEARIHASQHIQNRKVSE
jgi:hypothetical protein